MSLGGSRMQNDDPAEKHLNAANKLAQSWKFNAACLEFEKATRLRYGYAEAHAAFGSTLHDAGRYPEAVAQFQRAVEIDPAYPFDIHALSEALNRDVRQEEEIERF